MTETWYYLQYELHPREWEYVGDPPRGFSSLEDARKFVAQRRAECPIFQGKFRIKTVQTVTIWSKDW